MTTLELTLFNTYEEVAAYLGIEPNPNPDLSWVPEKHQRAILATAKLYNVFEAHNKANGDWKPDYTDNYQGKYSALFKIEASKEKPSGFGFSITDYDIWSTHTSVSSRLTCGSRKIVIHIGTAFEELFKDAFLTE